MPRIFQVAYLTISAASANSSAKGFLKTREEVHGIIARSWVDLPYLSSSGARGLVTLKLSEDCENFNSPNTDAVDSRAWTMQEQMLSPRLLQFCTFHIVWKCKVRENTGTSEAIERHQPGWSRERNGSLFDSRFGSWKDIIHDYTKRNLSCPSDKLIAMSAVAQVYGSIHKNPVSQSYKTLVRGQTSAFETRLKMYLAGLWRHEMPFALYWWRPWDGNFHCQPLVQRAPSWSWASVDGPVAYYKSSTTRFYNTNVTILECDVTLKSTLGEYGAVSSGKLKLRGRLKEGSQLNYYDSNINVEDGNGIAQIINFFPDARDDQLGHQTTISALALQIGDSKGFFWNGIRSPVGPYGLVLLPVGDNTFRRIGFFQADLDMGFDNCAFQDIIIV